jgi:catechol 2,3-dioxygenase-like lactoylglutathione lyase family enzyme
MISVRHVGLVVDNIEKSYRLYRDILGFTPKIDQIEKGIFYEHLTGLKSGIARTSKCYSKDGTCIELIEYQSQSSKKRHKDLISDGFNHIALNVNDIESLYSKLINIGIEFINKPKFNNEKTAKVAFCKDFEGNLIELVQTNF